MFAHFFGCMYEFLALVIGYTLGRPAAWHGGMFTIVSSFFSHVKRDNINCQ